jgi:hypothetical protein
MKGPRRSSNDRSEHAVFRGLPLRLVPQQIGDFLFEHANSIVEVVPGDPVVSHSPDPPSPVRM